MRMRRETLLFFKGKRVRITSEAGNNIIIHHGVILDVNDDSVIIRDKFNNTVCLSNKKIVKIEEIKNGK